MNSLIPINSPCQGIILLSLNGQIKYFNQTAKKILNLNDSSEIFLITILESLNIIREKNLLTNILKELDKINHDQLIQIETAANQVIDLKFIPNDHEIIVEINYKEKNYTYTSFLTEHIITNCSDLIFLKDKNLCYQFANKAYLSFLNLTEEELYGYSDEMLLQRDIFSALTYYQCYQSDLDTINYGVYENIEFLSNQYYYQVKKIYINDGILCIARDVTFEINTRHNAEIHDVTKLSNYKALKRVIKALPLNKEYQTIEIILENLGEIIHIEGIVMVNNYLKQLSKLLKTNIDPLFFYLDGLGFIGIFDKLVSNPQSVCELLEKNIARLKLPSNLKIKIYFKQNTTESGLFSMIEQD